MRLSVLSLLLLALPWRAVTAQDSITVRDYERAIGYLGENLQDKVFNAYVPVHWLPDSSRLWFVDRAPGKTRYLSLELATGEVRPLFDQLKIAELLSETLQDSIRADDLPLENFEYLAAEQLSFTAGGKKYRFDPMAQALSLSEEKEEEPEPDQASATSPDNNWRAYTEGYNLFLEQADSAEPRQLSADGKQNYEYASWYGWDDIMEGENGDRPAHFGVDWSPDGQWLRADRVDLRSANKMFLLDWSVDTLYRPRLLSYYRGSPGDTGMIYVEPVFFNLETGRQVTTGFPRATHINATDTRWSSTPGKVYLQQQVRGYQHVLLYAFDLNTGSLDTLYQETSPTNIDNFTTELAEDSGRMFFLSEKSGWRQLYSLGLADKLVRPVTRGEFYVNEILRVDEQAARIYFLASGREAGRNPYFQHLYRVDFDGSNLQLLTPENANHCLTISLDGRYVVDNYSTVDTPTRTVLRDAATGSIVTELATASLSGQEDWSAPETFTALARDGKTTIYGAVWKPTDFDSTRRYPVLDATYTGPHTHVYPTDFSRAFSLQSFAELGFVVVAVDGLGSSGRSKAFHDYSYKNLGGNLEDHVRAIRQLGQQHAWVDTSRVGIFGHSAGGYDAGHAVLAYPDFYKVAVASSADHDHRMEKAWWPEMYMGWPVDTAYENQSNITMAGNLKGKLLITHGGIDENVNPSATFKLAEALIRADKPFDMLILPGQRHGYTGPALRYFTKLRWNYFIEHLRGVEPIWDIPWEGVRE